MVDIKSVKWLVGTVLSCCWFTACVTVDTPLNAGNELIPEKLHRQEIYAAVMHAHYLGFKGDVSGGMTEFEDAIERYPSNVELRFQYSKFLIDYAFRVQNKKVFREFLQSAQAQLLAAIQVDPNDSKPRKLLAEICMELGEFDLSVEQLRSILDRTPDDRKTRLMLARLLVHKGAPLEAIELMTDHVAPDDDENGEALKVMALACGESGRLLEAIEYYDRYLAMVPGEFEASYNLALCLFRTEQLSRAESLLQEVIASGHMTTDVAELLIDILRSQGRHMEAIGLLEQLAKEPRYEVGAKIEIGQIYLGLNQPEKAYESLISAVSKDPNNKRGTFYTALALMESGEYHQALRMLENNLEEAPIAVTVADLGIELLAKLERFAMALKLSERAVVENPDNPRAYLVRAQLLSDLDQSEKTLELLKQAAERFPENTQIINALAIKLESIGQWREAVQRVETLFALYPDNPEMANFIGYTLADNNEDLDRAHQLIDQALRVEPDNPAYLDSLGWVLFRKEKYQEALVQLTLAMEKMPRDAVVLSHNIQALIALNRLDEAEELLLDALRLHPTDLDLKECRRLLHIQKQ